MARLNGVLALADLSVTVPPGRFPGLIFPIVHPSPGRDIGIFSTICRIHIIGDPLPGMYATTLFLVRASDFSFMGGCATDVISNDPRNAVQDRLADREFHFAPNFNFLGGDDSLLGVYRTFMDALSEPTGREHAPFMAKLDILYNFAFLDHKGNPE